MSHVFIHSSLMDIGLLPCLGYYKECCSEPGVHVSFWISFHLFPDIYSRGTSVGQVVTLVLVFKGTPIQSSIVVVSRRWRKESIIFLTEARGRWNLSTGILMGLESSSLSLVWVSQAFPCPTAFRSEFSQLSKNGDLSDREFPIPGFQCLVSAPGPPFK